MAEVRSIPRPVYHTQDAGKTILIQRQINDYDQTNAVEMIGAFNRFLMDVVSRYEANDRIRQECDQKSQDLLHFIELHDDMNASEGYKTYRKLAEVRRERRISKNENELLSCIYAFIQQNPKFVNELSMILGKTRAAKESIEKRIYSARTDVI